MTTYIQLNPGTAYESFQLLSRRLADERLIERMGAGAADLWPGRRLSADDAALAAGWTAAPREASRSLDDVLTFASEVKREGFAEAVVLGIGGSTQTARAFSGLLQRRSDVRVDFPLKVLGTTVPERVREVAEGIDLGSTLFIVASASGTTVETMLLYRYFRHRMEEAVGQTDAPRRFVAVTAAGSSLATLAEDEGFLRCFECPKDAVGRFSALTPFGLTPAALAAVDIRGIVDRAVEMHGACNDEDVMSNPGASLGAWLAALIREGRDKLTFVASPGARPLVPWIEQLVAESTGKDGTGLVPLIDEPPLGASSYGDDRAFVRITFAGESCPDTDRLMGSLADAGHPVAMFPPLEPVDVGAEMYRWQYAVVTASALAGLWPFDQPDVQASKDMAQRILAAPTPDTPTLSDDATAIIDALRNASKGSYLGVMAFTRVTPELEAALKELRQTVAETFGFPVTVGYGPGFLHSTGQLHKGGPKSLVGLQIHTRGAIDVRVPDVGHTFGDLLAAQADADLHMLRREGVPAFRLRCGRDGPASAVLDLCRAIRGTPSV